MSAIKVQKTIWASGRKAMVWWLAEWRIGTANSTRMEANSAMTPPSLFGMDRRMAYANRKYHSGCMCTGVTNGFAGTKFSGSPRVVGKNRAMVIRANRRRTKPKTSLYEK